MLRYPIPFILQQTDIHIRKSVRVTLLLVSLCQNTMETSYIINTSNDESILNKITATY